MTAPDEVPVATPGPPPLPHDLVIPPRPPLPAPPASAAPDDSADPLGEDAATEDAAPAAADVTPGDEADGPAKDSAPANDDEPSRDETGPADPTPADVAVEEPPTAKTADEQIVADEPRTDDEPASEPEVAAQAEPAAAGEPDSAVDPADAASPAAPGVDDPAVIEPDDDVPAAESDSSGRGAADADDVAPGESASEQAPERAHDLASDDLPVDDSASRDPASDDERDVLTATSVFERAPEDVVDPVVDPVVDTDVPALSLRGVTKSFGDLRAVDAIDLTVPAGSFYGLVGPNGAGKTTTLSIIAGLLRADQGTVSINGIDATRRTGAAKKLLGVLPDRLRTFDRLTGRQLLYYYGVLRGLPAPLVESRTADLARAFDIVEALARPVSDYSAGMTKKIMLAGAMIHSPRLLVLDEPFEAVDPVSSAVILDILGAYVAHGGTVVLSSHGMELVERVCSRVAVIVAGQVLAEGTVEEVRGEVTLEERFVELSGGLGDVEGLEWLHTFSG